MNGADAHKEPLTFPMKERLAGSSSSRAGSSARSGPGRGPKEGLRATGGGRGRLAPGASLLSVLLEWES